MERRDFIKGALAGAGGAIFDPSVLAKNALTAMGASGGGNCFDLNKADHRFEFSQERISEFILGEVAKQFGVGRNEKVGHSPYSQFRSLVFDLSPEDDTQALTSGMIFDLTLHSEYSLYGNDHLKRVTTRVSDAIAEARTEIEDNSESFQKFMAGALREASDGEYELTPDEIASSFYNVRMYQEIDAIKEDPTFRNHCSRLVGITNQFRKFLSLQNNDFITKLRSDMESRRVEGHLSLTDDIHRRMQEELEELNKPFMERIQSWHLLPAKSQYEIMEQDFLRKRTIKEFLFNWK